MGQLTAQESAFCLNVICQQEGYDKNLWRCSLNLNDAVLWIFRMLGFNPTPSPDGPAVPVELWVVSICVDSSVSVHPEPRLARRVRTAQEPDLQMMAAGGSVYHIALTELGINLCLQQRLLIQNIVEMLLYSAGLKGALFYTELLFQAHRWPVILHQGQLKRKEKKRKEKKRKEKKRKEKKRKLLIVHSNNESWILHPVHSSHCKQKIKLNALQCGMQYPVYYSLMYIYSKL